MFKWWQDLRSGVCAHRDESVNDLVEVQYSIAPWQQAGKCCRCDAWFVREVVSVGDAPVYGPWVFHSNLEGYVP